jgi:predicted NUDIX family NTP pyrophosphohydrolase
MSKQSAGQLLYRKQEDHLEVFLVHTDGPFLAKKDLGIWSIPKGEFDQEDSLLTAKREFYEETGLPVPGDEYFPLTPIKKKGGKTVQARAVEGELDAGQIRSNSFEMEWPTRFGKRQAFPEIDRGAWFSIKEALGKIDQGQVGLIHKMVEKLEELTSP